MCIGTFKRKKGASPGGCLRIAWRTSKNSSGRFRDALVELERAAKAWETCGPERAAELATNMEYRAALLDQLKRKDSANWLREKAAEARAGSA